MLFARRPPPMVSSSCYRWRWQRRNLQKNMTRLTAVVLGVPLLLMKAARVVISAAAAWYSSTAGKTPGMARSAWTPIRLVRGTSAAGTGHLRKLRPPVRPLAGMRGTQSPGRGVAVILNSDRRGTVMALLSVSQQGRRVLFGPFLPQRQRRRRMYG